MTQQTAELSPETVLEELKKNGVTHVVWLPDSETNWLYLLMQAEPTLDLITVSREGQAFSTASGLVRPEWILTKPLQLVRWLLRRRDLMA